MNIKGEAAHMTNIVLIDYQWDIDQIVIARMRVDYEMIEVLATVKLDGRRVTFEGCHIGGAAPNRIGPRRLIELANWVKKGLGIDELRIEGGTRTSGANPGHDPRPLVF